MATKLYDLTVKTGEYTDRQSGQVKGRWQNVGSVMQGDDGGQFVIMHRWFNPAGLPNPDNRDSVMLSCFAPNSQQGGQQNGQQQRQAPPQGNYPQHPPQQQGGYNQQQSPGMPPAGQTPGMPPQQGGFPPNGGRGNF